jgi:hypothetical protein
MSVPGGPPTPHGAQPTGPAHPDVPTPPPAGPFSHGRWGPSPYGTSRTYTSARGLATATVVLLIVMAVLSLARVGAHANRASILDDLRTGSTGLGQIDDIEAADGLAAGAAGLWLLGLLATGVVFIVWQFRHTTNAEALRGHPDGLGPGWSIGGWFIPFANLVLPGVQVFGASRPSDPTLPPERPTRRGEGSTIVVVWAVLLGAASVVERVGNLNYPDDESVGFADAVGDAITGDRLMAVGSSAYAVAAIVAATMVRQLTVRQDRRAAALVAAAGPGRPAPPVPGWSPAAPAQPPAWAPPPPPSAPPLGSEAWPGRGGTPGPPPHPPAPGSWAPPPSPWAPPGQTR